MNRRRINPFIAILIALACIIVTMTAVHAVAVRREKKIEAARIEQEKKEAAKEKKKKAKEKKKAEEAKAEADSVDEQARAILADMTLRDKIDQMMIVSPENLTGATTVYRAGPTTEKAIEEHPVGGLIYHAQNMNTQDQTIEMIQGVQEFSKIGLLIAVDEEGGEVARVAETLGTTEFDSMYEYRDKGKETAFQNANKIGSEIKQFGFNTDFAPVADVWSNKANTVIGERAYSSDFKQAAELVPEAVKGLQKAGVISCLKHFPGHGDTLEDSHAELAYTDKSRDDLAAQEWTVFKAGIDAGAEMVMTGHICVKQIDQLPATFSYKLITDELRGTLGFKGVIITDSLQMGAVTNQFEDGDAVVKAVQAGADMLLEPEDLEEAEEALEKAVRNEQIAEERLDESVMRILKMKIRYKIIGKE